MSQIFTSCLENHDEQTLTAIYQLQLQDLRDLKMNSKGKTREEEVADDVLALDMYRQELEKCVNNLSDRRMTESIAHAVQSDGPILLDAFDAEDLATRDRAMAYQMTGVPADPAVQRMMAAADGLTPMDDEMLAKLAALYLGVDHASFTPADEADEEEQAESSSSMATHRKTNRLCEVCREPYKFFDVARLPCRHEYCRGCLEDLFQTSMTDESLFPPRCCRQHIPLGDVRIFLSFELAHSFANKKRELETANRTYCYSPACSTFIPAEAVEDDVATCQTCCRRTCTTCKSAAHNGDCPNDEALQQLLDVATEKGWQRCYSCWRVIELDLGCNHITLANLPFFTESMLISFRCRCGAQFCYVCGQRWKDCDCQQWDEHRLLERANQIVDREPERQDELPQNVVEEPNNPLPEQLPVPVGRRGGEANELLGRRNIAVADLVQNLRERHECDHSGWRWVSGPHRCEECYFTLPKYIFECRQCRLQTCNRCRMNRL